MLGRRVGVGQGLSCVWPLVPIRPKRTVTVLPLVEISQNLAELPSTNSK